MEESKYPKRPDAGGKAGQPVTLKVNMLKVSGSPKGNIFQYDVNIAGRGRSVPAHPPPNVKNVVIKNPTKAPFNRTLIQKIIRENQNFFQGIKIAYDGNAILYTTRMLPGGDGCDRTFETLAVEAKLEETWDVSIKFVGLIPMETVAEYISGMTAKMPQRAITAIDVMLMSGPSHSNSFFTRGNSLFSQTISTSIGGVARAHQGFYTSARACKGGLFVNFDLSCTTFYDAQPLLDVLVSEFRLNNHQELSELQISTRDLAMLKQKLRNVQVETTHRSDYNRKVRIMGISTRTALNATFNDNEGRERTVADYFESQYNYRIRFPNLPLLECGGKRSYFPMEVCRIVPGQIYRKLNPDQTAGMIKVTCTKPDARCKKIIDGAEHLGLPTNELVKDMGLSVNPQMATIQGRVLKPPTLKYGQRPVNPQMGAWNMKDLVFTRGSTLQNWGVLVMCNPRFAPPQKVSRFVSDLVRMASRVGLRVVDQNPVILHKKDRDDVARAINELNQKVSAQSGANLSFLLCIIDGGEAIYRGVKRFCDSVVGIPSQCMLSKNLGRDQGPSPQYLGNILLKINAKLGGANHEITENLGKTFGEPTILMGADVTHPSGRADSKRPSIVAVVGSHDAGLTRYSAILGLQDSTQEHIDKLKPMVKEQLMRFYRANRGTPPARIVFFRDGVSEGQFAQVFSLEITAIRGACMEIDPNYKPKITFVVVQKRHHVRIFAGDRNTPVDRSGNVLPGTVVDTDIVHPTDFDFYMMTHAGIQGTSRPAHYYLLYDENGFSSDSLQKFINDISYTSARCTRSTSIPPPVFYAHLVAYRGRLLSETDLWEGSDTASVTGGTTTTSSRPLSDVEGKILKPHSSFDINLPMFFL